MHEQAARLASPVASWRLHTVALHTLAASGISLSSSLTLRAPQRQPCPRLNPPPTSARQPTPLTARHHDCECVQRAAGPLEASVPAAARRLPPSGHSRSRLPQLALTGPKFCPSDLPGTRVRAAPPAAALPRCHGKRAAGPQPWLWAGACGCASVSPPPLPHVQAHNHGWLLWLKREWFTLTWWYSKLRFSSGGSSAAEQANGGAAPAPATQPTCCKAAAANGSSDGGGGSGLAEDEAATVAASAPRSARARRKA